MKASSENFENQEIVEKFRQLNLKVEKHKLFQRPTVKDVSKTDLCRGMGSMTVTLDDVVMGIIKSKIVIDSPPMLTTTPEGDAVTPRLPTQRVQPFIKITLRKTVDILLYEQCSKTELNDSAEGRLVAADNQKYDYLTQGKERFRRTTNVEAQTTDVLYKARSVNTESIQHKNVASYVSKYEMFDTYNCLETTTKTLAVEGQAAKLEVTTYKVRGVDKFIEIHDKPSFKLALMLLMRILASNVFELGQRRFRNLTMPDPLALDAVYRYRVQCLWRYKPEFRSACKAEQLAVADISWCRPNGDVLAVAYGIYSFAERQQVPRGGCVCVWSIKNPVNPERCYRFDVPVVALEFGTQLPQLLAIGLYDGSIVVRDITDAASAPVAISQRRNDTSSNCEPIMALRWISDEETGSESFLALSQDGSVTRYRLINSPYLLANSQMALERVEGTIEGLPMQRDLKITLQANRRPQGLNLTLHPTCADIYYILTDEGCVHRCCTNYPEQHVDVSQAHVAGVNVMEFSPWSPKLFLTCGNDWCIRIWFEGITSPLITLKNSIGPIHCANWSKTHSTVIVAANRKSIEIWDIRRSTLKPVSTTTFNRSYNTMFKISNCGRSLALGTEDGHVEMLSFEDMPFPAHFQYDELVKAIINAIAEDKQMTNAVKSFGYIGYGDGKRKKRK